MSRPDSVLSRPGRDSQTRPGHPVGVRAGESEVSDSSQCDRNQGESDSKRVNAASQQPDVSSDSWCTPEWLCDELGEFDLDPCSNPRSHIKSRVALSLENGENGLTAGWMGSVYVNPPYSNPHPWCVRLASHVGPWIALVKLDTTTRWWAELMTACTSWAAFRCRIRFDRPDKPPLTATFPNALVWHLWKPGAKLAERLWIARYA